VGGACGTHERGGKGVQDLVAKPEERRPLGRLGHSSEDGIRLDLGEISWGCGVDSVGSGYGPVAGSSEHSDEHFGSGTTSLVS
jgi:hypothetical protein